MSGDVLYISDIKRMLPHRYPFLLIDRVEDIVVGESCVVHKSVSYNEWFFRGHFPEHPVMPGVLILEAMAQGAGVLAQQTLRAGSAEQGADEQNAPPSSVLFATIDKVKFKRQVIPGDHLIFRIQLARRAGKVWKFTGQASVNNELAAEAEFMAMVP